MKNKRLVLLLSPLLILSLACELLSFAYQLLENEEADQIVPVPYVTSINPVEEITQTEPTLDNSLEGRADGIVLSSEEYLNEGTYSYIVTGTVDNIGLGGDGKIKEETVTVTNEFTKDGLYFYLHGSRPRALYEKVSENSYENNDSVYGYSEILFYQNGFEYWAPGGLNMHAIYTRQ